MDLVSLRELLAAEIKGTAFEGKAYFAGGCVRDHQLGLATNDIDICVELPEGGIALAKFLAQRFGASEPIVYERFGTALLVWGDIKLEFVMTRTENYRTGNRNPLVKFGSLLEDIKRRDFTINAMLISISSGELIDLQGRGQKDLSDRMLKTTDEPEKVFTEDPLRILRGFRFMAGLDLRIDKDVEEAIQSRANILRTLSPERISAEFCRLLELEKASSGIRKMQKLGVLSEILPELSALGKLEQNHYHSLDAFEHTLLVLDKSSFLLPCRWAALLHDLGKRATFSRSGSSPEDTTKTGKIHFYGHEKVSAEIAEKVLKRFLMNQNTTRQIVWAIRNHMIFKQSGNMAEKIPDHKLLKLINEKDTEDLDILLDLVHSDNLSHHPDHCMPEQIPALRERIEALRRQNLIFPLTGNDIIAYYDISASSLVGKLLSKAKDYWYKQPDLNKSELLKMIRKDVR